MTAPSPLTSGSRAGRCSDPMSTCAGRSAGSPPSIPSPSAARRVEDVSARQLLDDVHDTLNAVPHYGIGYGLLRYLYAPTARLLGAARPADIFFSYAGTIPDLPSVSSDEAPVQFDADTAMPVREAIPGLGHAVELRVYRSAGVLHLDWWYDTRRVEPAAAESLADGFSTRVDGSGPARRSPKMNLDSASDELALVDLSRPRHRRDECAESCRSKR